ATDNARVLSVTAGFDSHDVTSSKLPLDNYSDFKRTDLKGLKIGIPREYMTRGSKMTDGMDAEVETSVEKTLVELEKTLGATVVDISLPNTPHALAAYYIIQPAEVSSNLARYDGIRFGNDRKTFGSEAKRRIILGTYTLSSGYYDAYYNTAQKIRTLIIEDFKQAFLKVDLIMAPVMPHLPFKIGQKVSDPLPLYLEDVLTVPVNLAGLPAISMPIDILDKKFPVGLQVIAPAFQEKLLLEVANVYQQATAWHTYEPSL
ncbi:MAG: amidase family protein, partial [Patescibacteria group bacterium]